MSEINLYCDEVSWVKPVLPNIYLVKCINVKPYNGKIYKAGNGIEIFEGCYGLTIRNDPFIIFKNKPEKITDENLLQKLKIYREFKSDLNGNIHDMYKLYKACEEAGFDRERDTFEIWLINTITEFMDKNLPEEIYDNAYKPRHEQYINQFSLEQIKTFIKNYEIEDLDEYNKLIEIGKKNDKNGISFDIKKYI